MPGYAQGICNWKVALAEFEYVLSGSLMKRPGIFVRNHCRASFRQAADAIQSASMPDKRIATASLRSCTGDDGCFIFQECAAWQKSVLVVCYQLIRSTSIVLSSMQQHDIQTWLMSP